MTLAPRICRDLRPWVKECVTCGHMKRLDEFALVAAPNALSFGGTQRECSECQYPWRAAAGLKGMRLRKWRPLREVA